MGHCPTEKTSQVQLCFSLYKTNMAIANTHVYMEIIFAARGFSMAGF